MRARDNADGKSKDKEHTSQVALHLPGAEGGRHSEKLRRQCGIKEKNVDSRCPRKESVGVHEGSGENQQSATRETTTKVLTWT